MSELGELLNQHGFIQPLKIVPGADKPLQWLHLLGSTAIESWRKLRQLVTQTEQRTDILSGEPYPEVILPLISTIHPWEVPAWLHTGSWNEYPEREVHICLLEIWYLGYGAELLGHAHDVLELSVARPVQKLEEARKLARLQYAYCLDIVDQGVQTLENLAYSLLHSTVWYFWWD